MAKYRKKPVEVEAIQFTASGRGVVKTTNAAEVYDFLGAGVATVSADHLGQIGIQTREGTMWASHGDWIIKEPFPTDDRKFYPCKPDIFEETYEAVDV